MNEKDREQKSGFVNEEFQKLEESAQRYFEREYNYLQSAGREFAQRHKDLAGLLDLDERQRKDPFVERLFEGFAFLAGRIHERLDDELPEITGGLLEQLFPHFLRPFPACAILKATAKTGAVTKPVTVPRGSEVKTAPGEVKRRVVEGERTAEATGEKIQPAEFIFRTTQTLTVRPMSLKDVRVEDAAGSASALILTIQPDRNVTYEKLELRQLRLYLHGAESLKYNLLLFLDKYVAALAVRELTSDKSAFEEIREFRLGIPELSWETPEELSILPYARQSFGGYRLLQEYFAFPERFFFVDIEGLHTFKNASRDGCPFEIKISFKEKISRDKVPGRENILLHCAPIVNLFDRDTEEVSVSQRLPEYYIIPNANRRWSQEIYAVKNVTGVGENKKKQFQYIPVSSYEILDVTSPDYAAKRFYSIRRRPLERDMAETYIRLFGDSLEQEKFPREVLSFEATLSNGFWPNEKVGVGEKAPNRIKEAINFPSGIEVENLTKPTKTLECPIQKNYLWALISHLTLSFATLAETETLQRILSLYNWTPSQNNPNKKRVQGITRVFPPVARSKFDPGERRPLRGIEFKLEVDPRAFEHGAGDIYLFGSALNRFLAQYVTINSVVFLTIIEKGTEHEYKWEPSAGQIWPV